MKRNLYVKLNNEYIKKNKPSIVLGTWSWGTGVAGGDQIFWNHLGEKELRLVFEEAMKNGLNLWDSAVAYGMGASETMLSIFTREYPRNEVLVSTKFTLQIANEKAENPVAEDIPMYYFGFSAQIKSVIDRFYAINGRIKGAPKKTAFLMAYANSAYKDAEAMRVHYATLANSLGWRDMGSVIAPGVWTAGSIRNTTYGDEAYQLGKSL